MAQANSGDRGSSNAAHDDALAALQNLGAGENAGGAKGEHEDALPVAKPVMNDHPLSDPRSKPIVEKARSSQDSVAALSASGFVSMLAKGANSASHSPIEGNEPPMEGRAMPAPARPQPKAVDAEEVKKRAGRKTDQIFAAREIEMRPVAAAVPMPVARGGAGAIGGGPRATVPAWYSAVIPIMFTVGSLLMLVGFWAVLGSIALSTKMKGVPLVTLPEEGQDWQFWDYIPYIMLLCIPVAIALGAMGITMQRQVKRAAIAARAVRR